MHKQNFLIPIAAMLIALPAQAAELKYVPYLGLDYHYIDASAKSLSPNYHAAGINLGTKYNDYFGTELFFSQTASDAKKTSTGKYKTSYRAYGLDIAAYLPLGCYRTFDLIATAGLGEYVFKEKSNGGKHHDNSAWGYRFGAGFAYNLTQNFSLRALARYVNLDASSKFDHLNEYTIGFRYHFL